MLITTNYGESAKQTPSDRIITAIRVAVTKEKKTGSAPENTEVFELCNNGKKIKWCSCCGKQSGSS